MGPDKKTKVKPGFLATVREGNRASQAERNAARAAKEKGKKTVSTGGGLGSPAAAATRGAAPAPSSVPGQARSGLGMSPSPVPAGPGAGRAGPMTGMPPQPQSQSIPGQAKSGLGTPKAALPTPATARGYQEGLKIGASKVAKKAAAKAPASTFQASPSAEFKAKAKPGLSGILASNKENIQSKALERMKKSGRKG